MKIYCGACLLISWLGMDAVAFSPMKQDTMTTSTTSLNASRREVLVQSLVLIGGSGMMPLISNAAAPSYAQENSDKEKIEKGLQRLTYLLDNWEKETTVCNRTDNPYIGCERTPEKVMEVSTQLILILILIATCSILFHPTIYNEPLPLTFALFLLLLLLLLLLLELISFNFHFFFKVSWM